MEVIPKSTRTPADLHHLSKKWKHLTAQRSPERNKIWIEPPPNHYRHRKVPVVYYLSRNGHLEHPHFIEVPLSSPDGLFLKDVINRLNSLRGKGMAAMYSWSSKRSYKNGFVWHDLSENDFIYPAHGQEYILKGSELFDSSKSDESASSISKKSSSSDFDFSSTSIRTKKNNQPWNTTAIDLHEYKVYNSGDSSGQIAANASTQTDELRRRRRTAMITEEEDKRNESYENENENESSELSRNEISPPPSDSSPETLESLMKSDDSKVIVRPEMNGEEREVNPTVGNKTKASSVLMQLISCGSISFRDCGPGSYSKHDNPEFSAGSDYESVIVTRGEEFGNNSVGKAAGENSGCEKEDGEYFSGSLIETKKDEFPALKRSNSFNAN